MPSVTAPKRRDEIGTQNSQEVGVTSEFRCSGGGGEVSYLGLK